jgi:hypothetical protein
VAVPEQWPWSSLSAYVGLVGVNKWSALKLKSAQPTGFRTDASPGLETRETRRQPAYHTSREEGAYVKADLCFGFSSDDWRNLAERLDRDEGAWAEAIGVFERRMRERFFTCIDALIKADTKPDSSSSPAAAHSPPDAHCIPGFSIMALCCLLIETMQGFREGSSRNTQTQFVKFLRRPAFNGAFADKGIAGEFVAGIRNGILHQAETRKWVIWRSEPSQMVERREDGYALNRTLFYEAVKQEFESYLRELNDTDNPANHERRGKFETQMNDICEKT